MTILQKIIEHKRIEVEQLRAVPPSYSQVKPRPSLYETLKRAQSLQVIAEMKRASPSKGDIASDIDPITQAKQYEQAGAACISVLTDTRFFKGSFADLHAVAQHVDIPVLCKDFVIDRIQIDYAKAAGASVVLLIVAALTDEELATLYDYATSLALDVLVEVHNVTELERALHINARIIGVNNRDLHTFEVNLDQTALIATHLQGRDVVFVSESGIWNEQHAAFVAAAGAQAVLVGESLMRSEDVEGDLRKLQVPFIHTPLVKICGLKTVEHVQAAVQAGADFIGFVFAPSKRRITVEGATQLAAHIPLGVKKVGVFVNEEAEIIKEIARTVPLDYIQYHGDETNDFIQQVGLPAIKAFAVRDMADVEQAATFDVDYYLFDTPGTAYRGGSGQTFDWSLLAQTRGKVIVAGGLTPDNVAQAIRTVRPAAVDVSSGVERDGAKDRTLITTFIEQAKGALQ